MKANNALDVTRFVNALRAGDGNALPPLLDCIYQELQALARTQLAQEKPGHVLQPTALVHEAYLRLMAGADGCFESRRHFFAAAAEAMRRILVDDARRRGALKRGGRGNLRGERQYATETADTHADVADASGTADADTAVALSHSAQEPGAREAALDQSTPDRASISGRARVHARFEDIAETATFDSDPTDLLAVNEALAELDAEHPELAQVVKLRFFVGLTGDQAAKVLGVSPRAVDDRWRLARAWLHQALSR